MQRRTQVRSIKTLRPALICKLLARTHIAYFDLCLILRRLRFSLLIRFFFHWNDHQWLSSKIKQAQETLEPRIFDNSQKTPKKPQSFFLSKYTQRNFQWKLYRYQCRTDVHQTLATTELHAGSSERQTRNEHAWSKGGLDTDLRPHGSGLSILATGMQEQGNGRRGRSLRRKKVYTGKPRNPKP